MVHFGHPRRGSGVVVLITQVLTAIAALAAALTAWLVYRRDWTTEHEVLEPELYWIGYQRGPGESEQSIRRAFAYPLHIVNRRGMSSVQRDLMVKVTMPNRGREVWLQPEYRLNLRDAVGPEWTSRQLYAPIAVSGRETVSWIIITVERHRPRDGNPTPWEAGSYHVSGYDAETNEVLFHTEFVLDKTLDPHTGHLPTKVFDDLMLTPRCWTKPTTTRRDQIVGVC